MERIYHIAHLNDNSVLEGASIEQRAIAREAVRVVLIDDQNRVALLKIGKYGVFKLPGGGIHGEEDLAEARNREICEETGCELSEVRKLGIVTENRKRGDMFQISHCYIAKGRIINEPKFDTGEISDGFSLHWASSLDEAIVLVGSSPSNDVYDNQYIRERDLGILKTARIVLEQTA